MLFHLFFHPLRIVTNPINKEKREEPQNEGTTQLKSTINHSVSVLPTCEADVNPIKTL
ncbi:hypothetical protein X777_11111 [Ooceraea biroi]|uniref:Uncharacterized protein n=1 Tax=Ooceraea biroi TaxID=2015173 RepID=A0A026W2N7_OOCBI|nr:hypothetical protein X777_11111 [Ooceraea biroi]